jgi:drug/metabolite transporter (DMT)-like permease
MLTFFAVAFRILVNPLSNVFQKRICAEGQSPLFANFLTYLFLAILVIPIAWHIDWSAFPPAFWGFSVLIGLFGALGNGFLVKAMHHGELSVLGPINAYKSVVAIIFGIILLGEIPDLSGAVGVALIVAGSYFVIEKTAAPTIKAPTVKEGNRSLDAPGFCSPALRYRIAAMVLAAIEASFTKKVILYSDFNTASVMWCWGGAFFSLLFLPILERKDRPAWNGEVKLAASHWLLYILLICSVGAMQWTTNYIFAHLAVGYTLALFQLSAVLSIFYGWFFFKETNIIRKLLASAVMVAGSVLIILSSAG